MEKRLYSHEDKRIALERQEYMCGGCGMDLWQHPLGFCQGHHILPYSMGGNTEIDNLIVLCPNCHVVHDNMAICGQMWGGYDIEDMQEEQMRDEYKFLQSIPKVRKNAENEDIRRTINKFKRKVVLEGGTIWKMSQQS